MTNFFRGIRDFFHAGPMIIRHRLWPWLLVPGLISLCYFPGLIWVAMTRMGGSADYLRENWIPTWMDHAVVVWVLTAALWMGAGYFGFMIYRNLIMIVYGPVLAIVSEKTERALSSSGGSGNQPGSVWRGMKRGTLMSITSLFLAVLAFIACWALVLVPILGGLLLAVALPLCQMFLAGQGFLDPTLERKGFGIRDSFRFCRRNLMRTIGCGAGFMLMALIPIVGWFLAPGFGIVAGTRSAVELMEEASPAR